jgi:hypothetical protein
VIRAYWAHLTSPMGNLEVKQYSVDGTTAARLWESRPLRDDLFTLFLLPLSFCLILFLLPACGIWPLRHHRVPSP